MGPPLSIEGTLMPDGTLVLDQSPGIPPGRVQVIVQPLAPADALHLATALENRCDRFLTNDHRLVGFQGIPVEVLP